MTTMVRTVVSLSRMPARIGHTALSTTMTVSPAWLMMYVRSCGKSRMFSVCRTRPVHGAAK
jgi:hypothetical protein